MCSIRRSLSVLLLAFALATSTLAGPNAGGVLNVHDANLVYTLDTSSYCRLGVIPDSCGAIDTNVESSSPEEPRVWKVYAVFPDTSSPRLKGLTFGVHYSPDSLVITAYGPCIGDPNNGAAEFPGPGWPGSDTGTALVFQNVQTNQLVECYWFAGYNDTESPTIFLVRAHPDSSLGGTFADDAVPAIQDPIEAFGTLGFGTAGSRACPESGGGDQPEGGGEDVPEGERQVVTGHVPADIERLGLEPTGQLPDTTRMHLAIQLPLPDRVSLEQFISRLYSPADALYHHFLLPAEFADHFGPTEAEYYAAVEYATSSGLTVTATHTSRLVMGISGTVADVERAFHIRLLTYNHPRDDRTFFAPDAEPSLDLAVPVLRIDGLDDYEPPRPATDLSGPPPQPLNNQVQGTGTHDTGAFWGYDFRKAYVPDLALTGTGQSLGLLEFDSKFDPIDIAEYEDSTGLPHVPLQEVQISPIEGLGRDAPEVALNIELAVAMAPGLDRIVVFEGQPYSALLAAMADSSSIKQLSASWTIVGPVPDHLYMVFAAQGQSFFNAAGNRLAICYPDDDRCQFLNTITPYATIVGGTELTTDGTDAQTYVSEAVWNGIPTSRGTAGGFCETVALPVWQEGVATVYNEGSATYRNVPDVACVAAHIWCIYSILPGQHYRQEAYGTSRVLKNPAAAAVPAACGLA